MGLFTGQGIRILCLWECGMAPDIWVGCPSRLQTGTSGHDDMLHLVESMQRKLTNEELEQFWVQSWIIWNQRNSVLYGGIIQDTGGLNQRAKDYLDEFREAQVHLVISDTTAPVQAWRPPSGLLYKMNFDAAVFANTNSKGFGVIIQNNVGEVMVAMSFKGPAIVDSEEAEVLACWRALEFAVDASFAELVLEGDNATVMKSIVSLRISIC